jgi:hypothetical protein
VKNKGSITVVQNRRMEMQNVPNLPASVSFGARFDSNSNSRIVSVKLSGKNVPGEQLFPVSGGFGQRAAFKKGP